MAFGTGLRWHTDAPRPSGKRITAKYVRKTKSSIHLSNAMFMCNDLDGAFCTGYVQNYARVLMNARAIR
jgi:riboflavin synthase alpha subunit